MSAPILLDYSLKNSIIPRADGASQRFCLRVKSEITAETADSFMVPLMRICQAIDSPQDELILGLREVPYIDSVGWSKILFSLRAVSSKHAKMYLLLERGSQIEEEIRITALDKLLDCYYSWHDLQKELDRTKGPHLVLV